MLGFFDHVAGGVVWTVEGTPFAGRYHTKAEFLAHSFEKHAKVLPRGTPLHVEHALVSGDQACSAWLSPIATPAGVVTHKYRKEDGK